ncbi:hypothetical protein BJ965_007020 [Streptomyces luteogriseus]|uniref:Uncharacterized protein n=1 Tax=Streptomyces luteogriseus TaxID=68233 RepID=A0A7W7GLF7_9ACTN|nr:hypothetical protein [Streptomyces luteogriseus]MBB4717138.1 hypothetical protein [Streptomyces luteogriseus]
MPRAVEVWRRTAVSARRAVPPLQTPPGGDLRALCPAAEQPDSITGAGR